MKKNSPVIIKNKIKRKLKGFRKTPRGIKKPKPNLKANPKRPHISTARLLREN